jgi:hypothetical protein
VVPKQKTTPLEAAVRRLQQQQAMLRKGSDYVPTKKKSKPVSYKLQNTFEKNLAGVPGGSMARSVQGSLMKQISAKGTGCRVVSEAPGTMRSMRNANTTQGSYNRTELRDQTGDVISNAQGRRI